MRVFLLFILAAILFSTSQVHAEDVCVEAKYTCRENGGVPTLIYGIIKDCKKLRKCNAVCLKPSSNCKKPCASSQSSCLKVCDKHLKGSKKRKCQQACKKKKRNCKSICKRFTRDCSSACRKKYHSSSCKRARRDLVKHLIQAGICTAQFYTGTAYKCIAKRAGALASCGIKAKKCLDQSK